MAVAKPPSSETMLSNQNQALALMNCTVSGQNIQYDTSMVNGISGQIYIGDPPNSLWGYWQNWYYPQVIRESYPVYIQERAMDKGKQAFEILKALMDKKLVKIEKVSDFIDAMDTLLKTL